MTDWDQWRADYDNKTYAEQLAFYDEVWRNHPDQVHFSAAPATHFFASIPASGLSVLEVGGWQGHLASLVIDERVVAWDNYEICRGAVAHPVAQHPFRSVVPPDWIWNLPDMNFEGYNVFVAAHVIEHMKWDQLTRLVGRLGADFRWAYVESPLAPWPSDWTGYWGSHVLERGWDDVDALFGAHGFTKMAELCTPQVRCFARLGDE